MDGKFCALLHLALVQRPEDHTIQHRNQHSDLLHDSFFVHVSRFATTIEAMEAPFLQWEIFLQVPGCTLLREDAKITLEEFVAEEDLHCGKRKRLIKDKVNKDNETVCTSNVPNPNEEWAAQQVYLLWAPHLQSIATNC